VRSSGQDVDFSTSIFSCDTGISKQKLLNSNVNIDIESFPQSSHFSNITSARHSERRPAPLMAAPTPEKHIISTDNYSVLCYKKPKKERPSQEGSMTPRSRNRNDPYTGKADTWGFQKTNTFISAQKNKPRYQHTRQ